MKKLLILWIAFVLLSCSKDDNNDCPNGEITSMSNNQDVYKISVDNGTPFVVDKKTFDYYAQNGPCYSGTK